MENPQTRTYVAYRFEKSGAPLTRVELPWVDPQEGEVVVKVLASGVCATDSLVQDGALTNTLFPCVPGHEVVGDIAAVHPSVKDFKVGQRVGAGWLRGGCGKCQECVVGRHMRCAKLFDHGTGSTHDGGLAQYMTVPTSGICAVPQNMDPAEAAPLFCAGLTVYKAMTRNTVPRGSLVAVHGVGGLGHLAIQYSKVMGYRTVAISSSSAKKDLSLRLGAEVYIDESTQDAVQELQKLGGAEMIITTVPTATGVWNILGGLGYDGKLVITSVPAEPALLHPALLCMKRLVIVGEFVGDANDCAETIAFSNTHGIKPMVETFPLDKALEAFDHRPKARFRSVVLPWA